MVSKNFPKLYKQSSTGKIQEWVITAHFDAATGLGGYTVTHGQVNGKLQTTSTEVRQGKNVGKANETTVYQQCCLEAESKWKKQLDKGYCEDPKGKSLATKPMLAYDYEKYKHQIKFPASIQRKLDGVRCIAIRHPKRVELLSRMGKPITTMGHIEKQLEQTMEPGEIWDGELYLHGTPFQTLSSWIKRKQEDSLRVQYHVYDVINTGSFLDRYDDVDNIIHVEDHSHIKTVSWARVYSHNDIKEYHDTYVSEGYEGAILRHGVCEYKAGYRSRSLLKIKVFHDSEYKIVGASEGKGKMKGCCVFECETSTGRRFECMPEGTQEQRERYWKEHELLIGKMLIVRYFSLTDGDDPVPRFPIGKAIRDYE